MNARACFFRGVVQNLAKNGAEGIGKSHVRYNPFPEKGIHTTLCPINKLIWTSSYVLFAGGWSLLIFTAFYWIIDVKGWMRWAFPFIVIGLNPITIYVAQGLFDFGMVANVFIHGFADYLGSLEKAFRSLSVLSVKWLFVYRDEYYLDIGGRN